jgi:uncharacterized membrane protein (Fun14 family)
VLLATAGPLALFVPDLYPPWPENSHLIGVLFCAVAAVASFSVGLGYAHQPKSRSKVQTAVATVCLQLGLASLIGYFFAYSTRVVVETQIVGKDQHQLRFVVGTVKRAGVDSATTDDLELLRDNQYSPERVWTPESVRFSRVLLLVTFIAAFSMLTFGMGLLATRSGTSTRATSSTVKVKSPDSH